MTENFVSAAELMALTLGAPNHRFVTIPHPISSASVEQLSRIAAEAAVRCVALLTTEADGQAGHCVITLDG